MSVSVVDPVSPAIERTSLVLFNPFKLGKWFTLGFCAFLANLGESGSGDFNYNSGGGPGGGGGGGDVDSFVQWIQDNLGLFIAIVIAVVALSIAIGVLITWISSRGKFMFLDGIVNNRGAVVAPWREYRAEGNSLLLFRIVLGILSLLGFLLLVGICALIAFPSIQAQEFGDSAVAAFAVGIPLILMYAIALGLIEMCLTHFVVPIMYLRRIPVLEAWGIFRHQFLAGRVGTFILYALFQIIMALMVAMIAVAATCLTCCIAALPYIGTVILLPLFVFMESYHLYFLQQFGPEWTFFVDKLGLPPDDAESAETQGGETGDGESFDPDSVPPPFTD